MKIYDYRVMQNNVDVNYDIDSVMEFVWNKYLIIDLDLVHLF